MSKSLKNAELKQSAIVQAALDLFLDQGFGNTSMDAIAIQAGVTKQTIYRYYSSKQDLFVAVMGKIQDEMPSPYEFGDAELEEELNNFGRDLLAFHLTPTALGIYKIMLNEGGQESLLQPFMQAGPNRVMKPLQILLQARYPKLQDTAFFAQMFASMVLVLRNQLLMRGEGCITHTEQQTHVNKVVRLFLQGLPIKRDI